ncbi:GNAT family N-acetyltransferase [Colwellia sp. D2M02]|uniref:GNAT family N-acetyltransferase n=1 Tax=Colwellia sp. D2M02 TaxID=2841562 RepID=UPI001C09F62E|nr:GNAT family N-acetyltransferase [Colwellia sp. D2M02]MBU2894587.1 GNAT family N-acetyltransferase [Colwellia sp. D2M02]
MKELDRNLANLNQFWQQLNASHKEGIFSHQSWPYKQWQADFTLPNKALTEILLTDSNQGNVFTTVDQSDLPLIDFKLKSHLVVMTLKMNNVSEHSATHSDGVEENGVVIKKLNKDDSALCWAEACGLAFGYDIDANVVQGLLKDTNTSVLAYIINGEIAGTAISYQSGDTLGIHQLGTVPNYRKMGVAAKLMTYLLKQAQDNGCHYVSLQASQAGLHLYEKMGFKALAKLNSWVRE